MKRREIIDGKTTCSKCKILKGIEEFGANKKRWDGLHSTCKACKKVERKNTYQKIKDDPELKQKVVARDRV